MPTGERSFSLSKKDGNYIDKKGNKCNFLLIYACNKLSYNKILNCGNKENYQCMNGHIVLTRHAQGKVEMIFIV